MNRRSFLQTMFASAAALALPATTLAAPEVPPDVWTEMEIGDVCGPAPDWMREGTKLWMSDKGKVTWTKPETWEKAGL